MAETKGGNVNRNNGLVARLHWALLPAIGEYYHADVYGGVVPLRWRLAYHLMKLVERLPGSNLFHPLPPIVCDCDECLSAGNE